MAHAADKSLIPVCPILGVDIAVIDMPWLLDYTKKNIGLLSGDYICVSNVHTTVTAFEDEEYRRIQNGGIMAIPDGAPLSFVQRRRGFPKAGRTAGPSYMEEIFRISRENGWKHYFYGSTPETLEKLRAALEKQYPGLSVVGMYSPPYRKTAEPESEEILGQINAAGADFLWIGLGAPKQERWMALHQGKVKGLMVGVGAGFDYFAGNIKRAPQWMQKNSLEWAYRLMQEPKRLFHRYFRTNTKFIWNAVIRKK